MERISRRAFCSACLAISGAAVAKMADAQAITTESRFILAALSSVAGTTVYATEPSGVQALQVSPSVYVWRETDWLPLTSLQAGDRIFVSLDPGPAGTYVATKIYANIVNYYGLVVGRNSSGLALLRFKDLHKAMSELVNVTYSPGLSYVSIDGIDADIGQIRPGLFVQIIGMKPPGQSLRATRVFAWSS